MAKKAKGAAPVAVTALNSTGRSKIASAMVGAIGGVAKSGNLITTVCTCAISVAGGVKLSDADKDAIMRTVRESSAVQAMKKPATRASVLSRWNTVLSVYSLIPEAEKKLTQAIGYADWHNVMTLASKLKKSNGDIPKAVKKTVEAIAFRGGAGTKPKTKKQALERAKRLVNALAKLPHLKGFIRDLQSLAVKHEILAVKR